MPTREYPLHKGAKTALTVTAVLCILLCVSAPFSIHILIRKARGKLTISGRGIEAALARQKVGGDSRQRVRDLERRQEALVHRVDVRERRRTMDQISNGCKMPFEQLTIGLLGVKWP